MTIPSEFAEFIREVGVKAFDSLAERLRAKETAAARRAVLRSWSKLSREDKESLMDELIASAQAEPEAAPAPKKKRASSRKKATART